MEQSQEIGELAKALALAQGELKNVIKEKEVHAGPNKKWSYADLGDGLNVIRPVLSKHGLSFVQMTSFGGGAANEPGVVTITTQIMHTSGQWIRGMYPVAETGLPHQEMGSAMTYARRYSLFASVGVVGQDDDDDGERAAQAPAGRKKANSQPRQRQQQPGGEEPDPQESAALLNTLLGRLDQCNTTEEYGLLVDEINKAGITTRLVNGDYERLRAAFGERKAAIEGRAQ